METASTLNTKNSLAILSVVLGVLSIAFDLLDGPVWSNCLGMLAIFTGAISLLQMSKPRSNIKWAAIAGILLGLLAIILTLIQILS